MEGIKPLSKRVRVWQPERVPLPRHLGKQNRCSCMLAGQAPPSKLVPCSWVPASLVGTRHGGDLKAAPLLFRAGVCLKWLVRLHNILMAGPGEGGILW